MTVRRMRQVFTWRWATATNTLWRNRLRRWILSLCSVFPNFDITCSFCLINGMILLTVVSHLRWIHLLILKHASCNWIVYWQIISYFLILWDNRLRTQLMNSLCLLVVLQQWGVLRVIEMLLSLEILLSRLIVLLLQYWPKSQFHALRIKGRF